MRLNYRTSWDTGVNKDAAAGEKQAVRDDGVMITLLISGCCCRRASLNVPWLGDVGHA